MMKRLRFLRALIAVGTAWGIAWAAITALFAGVLWLTVLRRYAALTQLSLSDFMIGRAILGFGMGATAGVAFACALALLERRRTVGMLRMWRVASWGGLTCMALVMIAVGLLPARLAPPAIADFAMLTAVVGCLGAGSAAATLSTARHAPLKSDEEPTRLVAPR